MDKDFLSSLTAESAARMKKRAITGARKLCNPKRLYEVMHVLPGNRYQR